MSQNYSKRKVVLFGGSDFHLEGVVKQKHFNPSEYLPKVELDPDAFNVCLLAGDITVPRKVFRYIQWFELFCKQFDLVLYVEGNHEHWHGYLGQNFKRLSESCAHIENLKFLSNETYEFSVCDTRFSVVASTLWASLKGLSEVDIHELCEATYGKPVVRDFGCIRTSNLGRYRKLKASEYTALHFKAKSFIAREAERLSEDDSYKVLMTHHSPTLKSLKRYEGHQKRYDNFDATDLESTIISGNFSLVFHGHIHREKPLISKVGNALLCSNPAGRKLVDSKEYELLKLDTIDV
ncbi:metallophosphoesterase [Vibrio coralliirubri]|uniref:metallophosphoesterase n=1 Tax=Vibrio coralliirubri TaxID=1516159 RepID=UPI002283A6A2|nr:metallophosphoesterase [Vibrio coralliirubri]MCY9861084.1 metallophosphoesterase [Vibrio coralliirubri]